MSSMGSKESLWLENASNYKCTWVADRCNVLHMDFIDVVKKGATIPAVEGSSRMGIVGNIVINDVEKAKIFYKNYEKLVLNTEDEAGDYCRHVFFLPNGRFTCEPGFTFIKCGRQSVVEQPKNSVLVASISYKLTTEVFIFMLLGSRGNEGIPLPVCGPPSITRVVNDDDEFYDSVPVKIEPSSIKEEFIGELEEPCAPQDSIQDQKCSKRKRDGADDAMELPALKRVCTSEQVQTRDRPEEFTPEMLITSLLCEEFESLGQTEIANILKLMESSETKYTGWIQLKYKYPEIDFFYRHLKMIQIAMTLCEDGVTYDPPTLSSLPVLSTNRIFSKLSKVWQNQPKKKSKFRKYQHSKLTMYFSYTYPHCDKYLYLTTGKPVPLSR